MNRQGMETFCYHLCRLLVGGVFFYAGAVKGADIVAFAGEIANYRILPSGCAFVVAAALPVVEMMAGTLLLFNRRVRSAALVTTGLNLVFLAALTSAWVRGLDISCGCFSSGGEAAASVKEALWRDLGLMTAMVFIFRLRGEDPRSA